MQLVQTSSSTIVEASQPPHRSHAEALMGEQTQPQAQTQSLLTPSSQPSFAATATTNAVPSIIPGAKPEPSLSPQTTLNASHNPPSPSKIPLRPRKTRKLSSCASATINAAVAVPDSISDCKSIQSVDDSSSLKPTRVYKDNGKTRRRIASQASRVLPRIIKPLSTEGEIDLALHHLRESDPLLAPLIEAYPPPTFDSFKVPFLALTRSIVFQQLACKAATSIYARFVALCGGEDAVIPETVLSLPSNELRQMGISSRKATYLYDLANKYKNGILSDASILEMDDKSLFTMLTMVKGIGSWSVHMFMIFSLHRPDVLPVNDLGIRKGVQLLYGLEELPRPSQMDQICEKWRPYRSVGSWYMWRLVEAKGSQTANAQLALVESIACQEQQQHQEQHQEQHQHQLQLLDPMNSIANYG